MPSDVEVFKAKVSVRGQISIPKEIRDKLGLKEGNYVTFREENGRIIIGKGEFVITEKIEKRNKG